MVAAEARGREQASGSLLWWFGVDDLAEERLRAAHVARVQESVNFQLGGPEKLTGANDPRPCVAEERVWRTCGAWMTATVPPNLGGVLAGTRRRQRQSRSGAEVPENRSHLPRERLGCSAS